MTRQSSRRSSRSGVSAGWSIDCGAGRRSGARRSGQWDLGTAGTATARIGASRSSARDAVGERLVGQDDPVAQHVAGQVAHVLGQRVVAAAQEGQRRAASTRLIDARGLAP